MGQAEHTHEGPSLATHCPKLTSNAEGACAPPLVLEGAVPNMLNLRTGRTTHQLSFQCVSRRVWCRAAGPAAAVRRCMRTACPADMSSGLHTHMGALHAHLILNANHHTHLALWIQTKQAADVGGHLHHRPLSLAADVVHLPSGALQGARKTDAVMHSSQPKAKPRQSNTHADA